ncbi:MAG TPA: DUF302 domain-containing protein [Gammaproteobacteria bacterium]|nr:DUF302 domain-containing protein [Gammaproteobacteria bacterium]
MRQLIAALLTLAWLSTSAHAGETPAGLVAKKSPYSVERTLDRLAAVLEDKGITIFARVSHSRGARQAGIDLRPTVLLIFGNPEVGSHFFTSRQTAGIDLPMKALAWKDAAGQVRLAYNDPAHIAERHGIANRPAIVKKMTQALEAVTDAAVRR